MFEYLFFFFAPRHLFTIYPGPMALRAVIILAVIFGLFILAGIILQFLKSPDALKRKGLKRFAALCFTMGGIGLVYTFFAWQGAVLLSARFWLLILGIVAIAWAAFIIRYLIVQAPEQRRQIEKRRQFEKYIP